VHQDFGNAGRACVGVIVNIKSGRNRRHGKQVSLARYKNIDEVMLFEVSGPEDVFSAVRKCHRLGFRLLVVQGGDGTVKMVLTSLFSKSCFADYLPKLLLVPAGTTNMTHADVGTCLPLSVAIREAVRYVQGYNGMLEQHQRYALRIEYLPHSKIICGMFFGAGLVHSGILYCRQTIHTKGIRGALGPGLALARYLYQWTRKKPRSERKSLQLQPDEEASEMLDFSILLATTLDRLLLRTRPFWGEDAGPLRVTFDNQRSRMNPGTIFRVLAGRRPLPDKASFRSLNCVKVQLKFSGGFTLDGELFGGPSEQSHLLLQAVGPIDFLA
jgi:hypothetical protein